MCAASLKHRLCVPDLALPGTADASASHVLTLQREQSHYLANVLRLRSGQAVVVFNGRGLEVIAQITHLDRKGATLELTQGSDCHAANAPHLTLAIALLKSQAMDIALQKATELGVDTITLLTSERTNVSLKGERLEKRMAHWRGVISAACEQSGRSWLPDLKDPTALAEYLPRLKDKAPTNAFLLEPKGDSAADFEQGNTTILIGPEGGWSDAELGLARRSGIASRKLGSTILRAETAVVAALSAVQQSWHWPPRH